MSLHRDHSLVRAAFAGLLLVGVSLAPAVPAEDEPMRLADRWRWRIFDRGEGVSPGVVSSMYWTTNDYLYAATDRGISRYDLHHWEVVENDERVEDGPVRRILEADGSIYCVTDGVLWSGVRRLERVYPVSEASPGPLFAAATREGQVFMIAGGTHYAVRKDSVYPLEREVSVPNGLVSYEIDASGLHWVAARDGLHYRDLDRRRWVRYPDPDLPYPGGECVRLIAARRPPLTPLPRVRRLADRELWGVFRAPGLGGEWRLARLEGRLWTPVDVGPLDSPPDAVATDASGHRWVTCDNGRLYWLGPGDGDAASRWRRVESVGIGSVKLHGVLLDSTGNLWFRLGSSGVAFVDLRSDRWSRLVSPVDPPYPKVLSLLETVRGDIWVGTDDHVAVYRGSTSTAPDVVREVLDVRLEGVTALGEEFRGAGEPGRVWVGSESFRGLVFFEPRGDSGGGEPGDLEGRFGVISVDASFHRIVNDLRGELWFLPGGLEREADPETRLWRSSARTGWNLEPVPIESDLEGFDVRGLGVGGLVRTPGDEDLFWLATESGLLRARFDRASRGRLVVDRRYTEEDGLVSSRVWAVEEGPDGSLWICYPSSGRGVTQVRTDAPGGAARSGERAAMTTFDVDDGLAGPEVWSIVRAGSNLWVATDAGLSRYDGEVWHSFAIESEDTHSSRVIPILPSREGDSLLVGTAERWVLRFESDDRRRPRLEPREFPERVRAGDPITFRWHARDYKNRTPPEQLIYRYRLDGGAWTTRRAIDLVTLTTDALSVGKHTFEIEVRDLDGNRVRDLRDRLHDFVVEPRASTWPRTLVAAAALLLLAVVAISWRARAVARGAVLERYRDVWRAFPAPTLLVDAEGRIVDWNGVDPGALGLDDDHARDIVGSPLAMVPTLAALSIPARLAEMSGAGALRLDAVSLASADGGERTLRVTGFSLGGERRRRASVVLVVEDVTGEAERERLLRREKRLRGIHDFADRLAALPGDFRELVERLSTRSDESVSTGGSAVAEALLARLVEPVDGAALPSRVAIDVRVQTGLWPVRCDEGRLEEALRAVLENARDAMDGRGRVTVRAANVRLEDDPGGLPDGAYVEITVRDDGHGMDVSQLETVFDPFWSTKPRDRAEGLGLSRAYAIARRSGGDIRIHSRRDAGTRVRLLLPAVR